MDDSAFSAYNNPAGRLAAFLHRVKERGAQGIPPAPNNNAVAMLAEVFGVDPIRTDLVFARLGDVMSLPEQVRQAVTNSPAISDKFAEFLPEVERYLSQLASNLGQQGLQVAQDTMYLAMELCGEQLSIHAPELVPDLDALLHVRDEISEVLEEVVCASIDPDLATFLVDHLHQLLDEIDRFRITGVTPIRNGVSQFLGDAILRSEAGRTVEDDPESKKVTSRVWTVVARLADVINITAGSAALTTFTMQALTAGHPH